MLWWCRAKREGKWLGTFLSFLSLSLSLLLLLFLLLLLEIAEEEEKNVSRKEIRNKNRKRKKYTSRNLSFAGPNLVLSLLSWKMEEEGSIALGLLIGRWWIFTASL